MERKTWNVVNAIIAAKRVEFLKLRDLTEDQRDAWELTTEREVRDLCGEVAQAALAPGIATELAELLELLRQDSVLAVHAENERDSLGRLPPAPSKPREWP